MGFNCNDTGAVGCQILEGKMKHLIAAVIGEQLIGIIGLYIKASLAGRLFLRCKSTKLGLLNYPRPFFLQRKTVLNLSGDRIPAAF